MKNLLKNSHKQLNLLKELAGSVFLPKKYQNLSIEKIIQRAKSDNFKKKEKAKKVFSTI